MFLICPHLWRIFLLGIEFMTSSYFQYFIGVISFFVCVLSPSGYYTFCWEWELKQKPYYCSFEGNDFFFPKAAKIFYFGFQGFLMMCLALCLVVCFMYVCVLCVWFSEVFLYEFCLGFVELLGISFWNSSYIYIRPFNFLFFCFSFFCSILYCLSLY